LEQEWLGLGVIARVKRRGPALYELSDVESHAVVYPPGVAAAGNHWKIL
jgi:hypothetical protein